MLKTLLVWITVLFLRRFGVNIDRKKLSNHSRRYTRPDMTRIERQVSTVIPPSYPTTIVVPNTGAAMAQRLPRASFGNGQETGPWVLCPNYDGRNYLPETPAIAAKPLHSKQGTRPPVYRPVVEKSENMPSQAKSVKRVPNTVALYGRKGGVVPVMTR